MDPGVNIRWTDGMEMKKPNMKGRRSGISNRKIVTMVKTSSSNWCVLAEDGAVRV
jgi:hypothetical protein